LENAVNENVDIVLDLLFCVRCSQLEAQVMLVGLAEMADLLGVTKQVLTNWRSRKANFPEPIAELKSGPVWDWKAIEAWAFAEGIEIAHPKDADPLGGNRPSRAAKVVALMNMKGGVGKSTLTANLGWHAAHEKNMRVLFVDLDPQFNLSQYILGIKGYEGLLDSESPTIDKLFTVSTPGALKINIADIIQEVHDWNDGSCLHLLPAKLDLAWIIRNAPSSANLLNDNLESLKDKYDLILIDCAPTDSVLSDAAYMAADYIFVPVRPEFLSTIGLPLLLESLDRFQRLNPNRPIPIFGGIIFNDTNENAEHDRARNYVRKVADEHDLHIFANEISHSDSYPVGSRIGKPIFLTDNARSWKKTEFRHVATEFLKRIGR
jgi:chromosome partitioning protein